MTDKNRGKYDAKKITLDEALAHIRSGDDIVAGFSGVEPMAILSKLHTAHPDFRRELEEAAFKYEIW